MCNPSKDGFSLASLLLLNSGRPEEDEEGVVLTRANGQRRSLSHGEEDAATTREILHSWRSANLLPSHQTRHSLNRTRNWRTKLGFLGWKDALTTWVLHPSLSNPKVIKCTTEESKWPSICSCWFVNQARSGYTVQFDCSKIRSETGPASRQARGGSLQTWQEPVSLKFWLQRIFSLFFGRS